MTTVPLTDLPRPDELQGASWSPTFERRFVPAEAAPAGEKDGAGRAAAWLRVTDHLDGPSLAPSALAFLSDDLPTDAVVRAHPLGREPEEVLHQVFFNASLDHTVWFHRPMRPDEWHLHDFTCHTFVGGRGLAIGHIFTLDGTHAATVAQEVLVRDTRERHVTTR